MTNQYKILTFEDAFSKSMESDEACANKRRLLLGNGFSMACDALFGYRALYEEVKNMGIEPQIEAIFERFGETNFEAVLKLLDDGEWMSKNYKMKPTDEGLDMRADHETLKNHLADAICKVHPTHSSVIPDAKYESCYQFISRFDDLYTINYDLLLYWASLRKEPFKFSDGFSKDKDTVGNDCEFMPHHMSGGSGMYFLHGALHLYNEGGTVRKRVWKDTDIHLTDQIRDALNRKKYPLVVAEGDHNAKLKQIEGSSYLSNCWRKFKGLKGHLFVFGSSLSTHDQHLLDAIAKNIEIRHLWIGIRGDFGQKKNGHFIHVADNLKHQRGENIQCMKKMKKMQGDLEVHFFDSDSAKVWS